MTTVVALVPAFERADSIAATVSALGALGPVDRVLVIDDGSADGTTGAARAAGAEVLRLPENRGKAGAVRAGVEATPEADVYLLIDADLAATAGAADVLLGPVLAGDADMAVGVLPAAGGRGGFGNVREMARRGILRACGRDTRAPLSGQRAVRADLLRGLGPCQRFGLEVALTIDAVRAGARVVEVDVPMDHRHTGRSLAGLRHRAGQGVDIARALWPRLVSPRARVALIAGLLVVALAVTYGTGQAASVDSRPPAGPVGSVVVFGVPRLSLADLGTGTTPHLDRLVAEGAAAAMTVRTVQDRPTSIEAYATLSAGTRVRAFSAAARALPRGAEVEGAPVEVVTERRWGQPPEGDVIVAGAAAAVRQAGSAVSSRPGALGRALRGAGRTTAVVGNADIRDVDGREIASRPAAVAVMGVAGGIDHGRVDGSLLHHDPAAPFGLAADPEAFAAAAHEAMTRADVTVLDPGEMDRLAAYVGATSIGQYDRLREAALRRTDALLGAVVDALPPDALLLVLGMTPPEDEWELTPVVAYGAGVRPGQLHSSSTRRPALVPLTDVTATVLDALGVEQPPGMVGRPLRYAAGPADVDALEEANRVATGRERVAYPMALTFIVVQALTYLLAGLILAVSDVSTRVGSALRFVVLTFAAWPLATFLVRAVPVLMTLGAATHLLVWAVAAAVAAAAGRARGHPLAALARIAGLTVLVLVVDVATGARLQSASILGYSPHTAARFTGYGNTAYVVLAVCALVVAVVHVDRRGRSRPVVAGAAALLALVVVADGAPWLGADAGGILSLVPVAVLTVAALAGWRITWRWVAAAGVAAAGVLATAAGLDLLSPAEERTHLANFVIDSTGDSSTFATTVARKWSANVRIFRQSAWTWAVPVMAAFFIYVLVIAKGWQRLLPARSALRVGVVGAVGVGLLGWLVNDSGVVVTALVFVYLGPYLTLVALHERRGGPELLPPTAAADGGPTAGRR